jgi:hypothetical protein
VAEELVVVGWAAQSKRLNPRGTKIFGSYGNPFASARLEGKDVSLNGPHLDPTGVLKSDGENPLPLDPACHLF